LVHLYLPLYVRQRSNPKPLPYQDQEPTIQFKPN